MPAPPFGSPDQIFVHSVSSLNAVFIHDNAIIFVSVKTISRDISIHMYCAQLKPVLSAGRNDEIRKKVTRGGSVIYLDINALNTA